MCFTGWSVQGELSTCWRDTELEHTREKQCCTPVLKRRYKHTCIFSSPHVSFLHIPVPHSKHCLPTVWLFAPAQQKWGSCCSQDRFTTVRCKIRILSLVATSTQKNYFSTQGCFWHPCMPMLMGSITHYLKFLLCLCWELLQTIYQSLSEVANCFGALQHDRTNYREDLICIMVQHSQLHIAEIRK